MKRVLFGLGMFFSLSFCISCQREIDWGIPQNGDKNDGTVLSKYIEFDPSLPSAQDTTNVYTFTYDNSKRIKRIYLVGYVPGSAGYQITTDFFYNGTTSLPYKTIEVNQQATTYVDTSFYTFNNGFVTFDSSVNYRADNNVLLFTDVVSFSVTANKVFVRFKESTSVSSYQDSSTLTITRQNGNIIAQQDSTNAITDNMQLNYDNKVNPLYNVDIHYPIVYQHLFNSFNAQRNNLSEALIFSKFINPKMRLQYVYTYRSDGYPLTVNKNDLLHPAENRKGVFLYTK